MGDEHERSMSEVREAMKPARYARWRHLKTEDNDGSVQNVVL
jgi:hypothetical protein